MDTEGGKGLKGTGAWEWVGVKGWDGNRKRGERRDEGGGREKQRKGRRGRSEGAGMVRVGE